MPASIPTHAQWKTFKKNHGVGSNAVGSVNVGKALDAFHKVYGRDMTANAKAADACAKELTAYLNKFPDKAAKDPKKFKSEFDKIYVKPALTAKEEFQTMAGEKDAFAGRVVKLLDISGKLKPGVDLGTLQQYRQGPVRGMLASATAVKKYDPKDFVTLWKPIDDTINNLNATHDQATLDKVVKLCHVTAKKTLEIGKKDALF